MVRRITAAAVVSAAMLGATGSAAASAGREASPQTRERSDDTRAAATNVDTCPVGGHFCFHYSTARTSAAFVEKVRADLEKAYDVEVTTLGWKGSAGTEPPTTDVYFQDLANPANGRPHYGEASQARLTLDDDFDPQQIKALGSDDPDAARQATIAHEFNHVLQFRYAGNAAQWQAESVATWMEDRVFPDADDYVHFVKGWAACPQIPLTTPNSAAPDACRRKVYGAATFNHWLSTTSNDPQVIRRSYENLSGAGGFAPLAYGRALGGEIPAFRNAFAGFAAASAEWGAPGAPFPDRNYEDVTRVPGPLTADVDGDRPLSLDHTAYALYDVTPSTAPSLRLHASLPAGVSGALALVGRTGGALDAGIVTTKLKELPDGGPGDVTLETPGNYGRITAVVVNTDVDRIGGAWPGDDARVCNLRVSTTATGAGSDTSCADMGTGAGAGAPGTSSAASAAAGTAGSGAQTTAATRATTPVLGYRLTAPARQRRSDVLARGLAFRLRCDRRCSATATITLSRRAAKRLRLPRVIGTTRSTLTRAGSSLVRVKLTRQARKALRRASHTGVSLAVRARSGAGPARSSTHGVVIVR